MDHFKTLLASFIVSSVSSCRQPYFYLRIVILRAVYLVDLEVFAVPLNRVSLVRFMIGILGILVSFVSVLFDYEPEPVLERHLLADSEYLLSYRIILSILSSYFI